MVDLKHAVQEKGFTVAHIKTDSIKIPNATPEIIKFVMEFGKEYGYTFEHEATYEKMCLVNDAVYVAKYADGEHEFELPTGEKIMTAWTATGTQFQVPYVFKTLFAKKPIIFSDMCETKSVTSGSIYLDMNEKLPNVEDAEKELKKIIKDHPEDVAKISSLEQTIATGHNYIFVGRVGLFCPIKKDKGGGLLMREKDGKYYAVTGTKGYRWLEAEQVKNLKLEDSIDITYYLNACADAIEDLSKYGDFEWFVSDMPYDKDNNGIDDLPF